METILSTQFNGKTLHFKVTNGLYLEEPTWIIRTSEIYLPHHRNCFERLGRRGSYLTRKIPGRVQCGAMRLKKHLPEQKVRRLSQQLRRRLSLTS